MENSLTHDEPYGLFIAMQNAVTPDEMDGFADRLEEAARGLRVAASALRGTISASPATPSYVKMPPTAIGAVERALRQASRPLHISELFEKARSYGATVKDQANLSSMLSKDGQVRVRPTAGRRGFWELVPASKSSSNLNQPGA